mgnify:CR=1 FL=1
MPIDRITGLESDPEKMAARDVLGWISRAGHVRVGPCTAYLVKPAIIERARQLVEQIDAAAALEVCHHETPRGGSRADGPLLQFVRSVGPSDLTLGANDQAHCARWAPDCKASISWAAPGRLRVYRLPDGTEVMVCRKACADVLARADIAAR